MGGRHTSLRVVPAVAGLRRQFWIFRRKIVWEHINDKGKSCVYKQCGALFALCWSNYKMQSRNIFQWMCQQEVLAMVTPCVQVKHKNLSNISSSWKWFSGSSPRCQARCRIARPLCNGNGSICKNIARVRNCPDSTIMNFINYGSSL